MNAAACRIQEPDVLPLEAVNSPGIGNGPAQAPPPLPDVSLKVPSDRDLQIYETVVFAGRSQRAVAKEFGVSQPRVNQILKEIAVWMADNTPSFCSGLTPEQQLRLVHYNVVQQLEYQRCSLMEAWEESRRSTETISRTTIVGGVSRTTATNRPSRANSRYVDAAARTSLAIAKLSGWTPAVKVTDAPQNSPWWKSGEEEEGESRQEAESSRQVDEPQSDLSDWEERARNPNLTRVEAEAIPAERQAICASLMAKVADLEAKIRKAENGLSTESGPLLPAEGDCPDSAPKPRSGRKRSSRQEREIQNPRREFLRGGPSVMSIREYIGPASPLEK